MANSILKLACLAAATPTPADALVEDARPVEVTEQGLTSHEFGKVHPLNYLFPSNGSYPYIDIKLGESSGSLKPVKSISIVTVDIANQYLSPCPDVNGVYKYNLDTPNINWASNECGFKELLKEVGVAQSC